MFPGRADIFSFFQRFYLAYGQEVNQRRLAPIHPSQALHDDSKVLPDRSNQLFGNTVGWRAWGSRVGNSSPISPFFNITGVPTICSLPSARHREPSGSLQELLPPPLRSANERSLPHKTQEGWNSGERPVIFWEVCRCDTGVHFSRDIIRNGALTQIGRTDTRWRCAAHHSYRFRIASVPPVTS